MTKVAFCFPGQGSLEEGMGREIALAVPEAMEVYRVGSEATGMDLAHLCFEAPLEARRSAGAREGIEMRCGDEARTRSSGPAPEGSRA